MTQIEKTDRIAWIISCGVHLMQVTDCTLNRAMCTAERLWTQLGTSRPEPIEAAQTTARALTVSMAYEAVA